LLRGWWREERKGKKGESGGKGSARKKVGREYVRRVCMYKGK